MKTLAVVFVLILYIVTNAQPVFQYGESIPDICAYVQLNTDDTKYKKILATNAVAYYLGRFPITLERRRAFFQWQLPDSIIPDSSVIHTVHLSMQLSTGGINEPAPECNLFSVKLDLNTASASELWSRTDMFNNNYDYFIGRAFGKPYSQSSNTMIVDTTYVNGTSVVQAIEEALLDDYFTLGIVEHLEEIATYIYRMAGFDVKLQITFTPPKKSVLVTQVIEGKINPVDSIGHFEDNQFVYYPVPHTFTDFYLLTTEVFKATQELLDTVKYNRWENFTDVVNPRGFEVTEDLNELKSILSPVKNSVIIKNHFIDIPNVNPSGDIVEFKDPWLIDSTDANHGNSPINRGMAAIFRPQDSPFNPDYTTSHNGYVYQGVFLKQNETFDPNIPIYSVRAPSPQILPFHGEDIAWYFQGWEGSNVSFQDSLASETPVVFLSDSAEVLAVYKGHLVTDNLSRLGFSSQRHIARGGTTWYLTYWEDGKIYVSTSTDGVNWNPEVCVSGNLDGCSRPSIAAGLVNGYAYVVWQRKIDTDQYEVYVSRTSNSGQSWSSPHKLSTVHITTAQRYGPQPVVAEMRVENPTTTSMPTVAAPPPTYTYHTLIAYVCDSGLKWHKSTNQGASWGSQQNIPVANTGYVWFPSMVSGTDYVALVYSYRSASYEVTSRLYKGKGWSSPANVSGALGLIYDRIPSVSIDRNGNLFCAWLAQESGNTNYKIAIRQGDSNNNWSSFNKTAFYPPDGSSAHGVNINFINNTDLDVVFHTTGKRVYRREYPPSLEDYVSHTQLSSNGYYGNLPAFRQSDFADAFALWLENTGAPYLIKNTLNLNHGSDAAGVVTQAPAVSRRVVVCLAPGDHVGARFLLGDIRVGSQRVKLSSVGKDGVALSGATVGEYLRSEVFHVAAGVALRARVEREVATGLVDSTGAVLSSGDYEGIVPYVEVVNVADGGVIWRGEIAPGQHEFEWVGGQDIPAGDYVLRVMVTGDRQGYSWYTHTESSYVKSPMAGSDVLAAEEGMEKDMPSTLPQKFDLKPAYPNPFNPSTTIGYALPEASEVALEVYNVQGQRIRELVGGRQPAGWHAVVWDGRNSNGKPVPSGVYVVRMTAHPVRGSGNAFVASRKVVLMK